MTIVEIISQIINCIGSTINMIGINVKDKRKVLIYFTFGNLCVAISLGLLGAKVGMLVQTIFVVQTIVNSFWERKSEKYPIWLILLYVIIPSLMSAITFETTWDFLPIIAAISFPLAMLSKNLKLRLLNLLSVVVWIPYNFHFGQYVGALSCSIFTVLNIVAIIRLDCLKKKSE